jgi:hypothetical protein
VNSTPESSPPTWGIRIAAALLTGSALWAWLAWQDVPQALLVAAVLVPIQLLPYDAVCRWWLHRKSSAMLLLLVVDPLAAQRTLTVTPQLTIDGVEHDFSRVGQFAVSAQGRVAVPQQQDGRILFFDSRGVPNGRFGRTGSGPGEFRTLVILGWVGDTLLVSDPPLHRVTMIGPDLKLIRTLPLSREILPPRGTRGASFSAMFSPIAASVDDGMLATILLRRRPDFPGWIPFDGEVGTGLIRVGADSRFRKLIAVGPASDQCRITSDRGGISIPFCFRPTDAASPNGRHVVFVVPGATGSYAVVEINGVSGDTSLARQYTYQPVPVPKRLTDSILRPRPNRPNSNIPPGIAELRRQLRVAEHFPPVVRAVVGDDGMIWLEEQTLAPADQRWMVLDPAGNLVGVMKVPRAAHVRLVFRDQMWATVEDEDGVQDVVRYGVR